MGYTHYWKQHNRATDEQWKAFKEDVERVVQYATNDLGIELTLDEEEGQPIINNELVFLNGKGEDAHETFVFERNHVSKFSFCKTQRKPYDIVVCSILLLAHYHMMNAITVESDGLTKDWMSASKLNELLFDYADLIPDGIDEDA